MSLRFWAVAAIYHVVLVAVCAWRARAWLRRDPASLSGARFGLFLSGDALSCGVAALAMALLVAPSLPDPQFAAIRLWAQALFGEVLLFLVLLSALLWRRRAVTRAAVLAGAALVLLAVYVDAYHVEPHRLRVEEHGLDLSGRIPGERHGSIRVLHISDIQTHRIGEHERRVVRRMARLEPDLVVLTGDYVHERLRPTGVETGIELAGLLRREGPRPSLGTWAVGGDTDGPTIERQLREAGVGWLDDEAVTIAIPGGRSLALIGLAPATSRRRDRTLRRLVASVPPDALKIVLGHAPDFVCSMPTTKPRPGGSGQGEEAARGPRSRGVKQASLLPQLGKVDQQGLPRRPAHLSQMRGAAPNRRLHPRSVHDQEDPRVPRPHSPRGRAATTRVAIRPRR